jgi:hypothetical protein
VRRGRIALLLLALRALALARGLLRDGAVRRMRSGGRGGVHDGHEDVALRVLEGKEAVALSGL